MIEPAADDLLTRVVYRNDLGQRVARWFHTNESNWRTLAGKLEEDGVPFFVIHRNEEELKKAMECVSG